ncbi:hypothetical protein [Clostridium perfringens]|uniref:hypothetical protein n=1 Tax=Clostridium perfringens TaxID=1502 RepID=UPI0024BD2232|nr:hypothetical protein [Clostridium perfringens]
MKKILENPQAFLDSLSDSDFLNLLDEMDLNYSKKSQINVSLSRYNNIVKKKSNYYNSIIKVFSNLDKEKNINLNYKYNFSEVLREVDSYDIEKFTNNKIISYNKLSNIENKFSFSNIENKFSDIRNKFSNYDFLSKKNNNFHSVEAA